MAKRHYQSTPDLQATAPLITELAKNHFHAPIEIINQLGPRASYNNLIMRLIKPNKISTINELIKDSTDHDINHRNELRKLLTEQINLITHNLDLPHLLRYPITIKTNHKTTAVGFVIITPSQQEHDTINDWFKMLTSFGQVNSTNVYRNNWVLHQFQDPLFTNSDSQARSITYLWVRPDIELNW